LAAKAADAKKAVALKAAGLSENATAAEVVRLFKSTAADVDNLPAGYVAGKAVRHG
jgi:hypothetical protein